MNAVVSNLGSRVDLALRTGSDFLTTLAFTNADGTPLDLTGTTLAAQLRKLPADEAPTATFIVAIVGAPTAGVASLSLPAATTATIPCGASLLEEASRYVWDLKLTDAAGNVSAPIYGAVRVAAGVTP